MSDDQYFRSCVAQERHLAHLLGHHNIEEDYESAGVLWDGGRRLPQWGRDWQACGPLLARYGLSVSFKPESEAVPACVQVNTSSVRIADHPSREHALRFAIVKAVIFLLEHPRSVHCP